MPIDLTELAIKTSILDMHYAFTQSLTLKRQTSSISESLLSEASKLAGLSAELAKRSCRAGSVEERVVRLATRLDHTNRLLSVHTSHYTDSVQQVCLLLFSYCTYCFKRFSNLSNALCYPVLFGKQTQHFCFGR